MAQGERGGILELRLLIWPRGVPLGGDRLGSGGLVRRQRPDVATPIDAAQAAAIPRCRVHFLPGEGHFSLPAKHIEEILAAFPAAPPAST